MSRKLGVSRVIDLSAMPFFLSGSGYAEGTLFPWVVSDFSLMDAIECGIVKLPRVPVAENIPGDEMPVFRNLWENIRKGLPKKGRGIEREVEEWLASRQTARPHAVHEQVSVPERRAVVTAESRLHSARRHQRRR